MNICRAPKNKQEFQAYYHLRWLILRKPWQQSIGSEQDELEEQAIHRLIINDSDEILAIGRLHQTSQNSAQIRYMAVAEFQQGQGLGRKIIENLELEAIKRGVRHLSLNAREPAICFYQKLGYELGELSHVLFGDIKHFAMTKILAVAETPQGAMAEQLCSIWHQTIPLSKAMNVNISYYDALELMTTCELTFNKNLHNTMFAGSIYTLATLTGWGWVYLQLQQNQLKGDIVLADATIRYLFPIKGHANALTGATFSVGDISLLCQGKKAKLQLQVEVWCGDKVAAIFNGLYFVLPTDKKHEV